MIGHSLRHSHWFRSANGCATSLKEGGKEPYRWLSYFVQSSTTLPDLPEFMASKPFWKSV